MLLCFASTPSIEIRCIIHAVPLLLLACLHLAPCKCCRLHAMKPVSARRQKRKRGIATGTTWLRPPEKLPSFTQPAEAIGNNRKQGPAAGPRNIENDRHDPRILPPELQIDSQPCHSTSISLFAYGQAKKSTTDGSKSDHRYSSEKQLVNKDRHIQPGEDRSAHAHYNSTAHPQVGIRITTHGIEIDHKVEHKRDSS